MVCDRFQSSNDSSEQTSLQAYVDRMKEKQEHIYFIAGSSRKEVGSGHAVTVAKCNSVTRNYTCVYIHVLEWICVCVHVCVWCGCMVYACVCVWVRVCLVEIVSVCIHVWNAVQCHVHANTYISRNSTGNVVITVIKHCEVRTVIFHEICCL